jgi:PPOX class probable F420-dependent enzyme
VPWKSFLAACLVHADRDEGGTTMTELTDEARTHLEAAHYWSVATLNPDGSPQVTPVWAGLDGDRILINTAAGRKKDRNLQNDPRVALCLHIPESGSNNIGIQGRVVERVEGDRANADIDALSRKYTGKDYAGWTPGMRRVTYLIEPLRVFQRI